MDFKDYVFNAASNGDLLQLKVLLDEKPKEELCALVSALTNDSTPLAIACTKGYLDVAVYLIESCYADIEQVVFMKTDKGRLEAVSPLWCAATSGHLNIVKMLVKYIGAVNNTKNEITRGLRGACLFGQFEIVKYLIHHGADFETADKCGHTCLMNACLKGHYDIALYLIECGADMNKRSGSGCTALHYCLTTGRLDILKLLIQYGAKSNRNSYGTTPLLSAAAHGHAQVVAYFINECNCSKRDKINALEVLGTGFMNKTPRDMVKAFKCWKLAMLLRYEDVESPFEKPVTRTPIASCVDATEVRTLRQLEELNTDPYQMMIQALLAAERILGPSHPLTHRFILNIGIAYAEHGLFGKCIELWKYALRVQEDVPEALSVLTDIIISHFVKVFSSMMTQGESLARGLPSMSFEDILYVFKTALREIEIALNVPTSQRDINFITKFYNTLINTMHLIGLMCRLKPHLNEREDCELKRAAYELVRLNLRAKNGRTPLHLACCEESSIIVPYSLIKFPSPAVVDLLLEVGALPNAVDEANNTVLHVAAMNKSCDPAVFNALLNHGAHLDHCNHERQTPLQLAPSLISNYMRCINLKCLSAKVILRHKIAYKEVVHETLKEFIDSH